MYGNARADVIVRSLEFAGVEPPHADRIQPTVAQLTAATEMGIRVADGDTAASLAERIRIVRELNNRATEKQVAFLAKHAKHVARPEALSKKEASSIMGRLIGLWKRR
jgi:hypothetical protein